MGLFGGDSKSKTKVSTSTEQIDRRVAGSDAARVATEGSTINTRNSLSNRSTVNKSSVVKVSSVDADVVRAALDGTAAGLEAALSFSGRQAERDARVVEAALANTGGELAGLKTLVGGDNKQLLYLGAAAIALLVALR